MFILYYAILTCMFYMMSYLHINYYKDIYYDIWPLFFIYIYCIAGKFGGDFNLVSCQLMTKFPNLRTTPMAKKDDPILPSVQTC